MILILRPRKIFLIFFLLLSVCVLLAGIGNQVIKVAGEQFFSPLKGKIIAIDPGHGGDDPGVWDKKQDIKEKDINLAVALQLKENLTSKGAKVIMTREKDTDYILHYKLRGGKSRKQSDLDKRIEIAEKGKADVLISIHVNATTKANYGGAEVFYYPTSINGRGLAQYIQDDLRRIPEMIKRIPKTGNYYILHHSPMPAVIVELGCMTYKPEKEKLLIQDYQQQLVQAISAGVEKYFKEKAGSEENGLKAKVEHREKKIVQKQGKITLYFSPVHSTSALLQGWEVEEELATATSDQNLAREVMRKLLQGPPPDTSLISPFPEGTKLRSVDVSENIATVDLSREISNITKSSNEKAVVYSIVGSLLSLPEIKGVRILVEGEQEKTLAGHVDTLHTFHDLTCIYQDENGMLWETDRPRAVIVIDDLGAGKKSETKKLLEMKIPLTLAVLPENPFAADIAKEAMEQGHQVILHLPMEAYHGKLSWLGQNPILVELSNDEIEQRFLSALKSVPNAVGFNNHMGSRATEDQRVVKKILEIAAQKNLFILDSRTTMKSLVSRTADELGIPYVERTVFLDGPENTGQVERQLRLLAKEAKKKGIAVGIGHVGQESRQTVELLKKAESIMKEEGVILDYLSGVVK